MTEQDKKFMMRAIELARLGMESNAGGPFGCVVVKNGEIVGEGSNSVTSTNDPTAHAEIVAIRHACKDLGSFRLDGCTIYTSCEPCPMCLGAIYWSRPAAVFFAATQTDAAAAGFDDEYFYKELERPNDERQLPLVSILRGDAQKVFSAWREKTDKTAY